jgi:hypothetical protein
MNREHEKLAAAYMAGEDVADALLQACREHPELLKELAELSVVDRLLTFHADEESSDLFAVEVRQRIETAEDDSFVRDVQTRIQKGPRRKMIWFVRLAAAASLAMGTFFFFKPLGDNLATLTVSTDAVWESQALASGDSLGKGHYTLAWGYSEVTMNNGVRLILEAPIELQIESVDLVRVTRGRLVARVPKPAIGFTVLTPGAEVVDLGTEFGISVADNGASEVHVLEGEVKARSLQKKDFSILLKDEGMAFDENQQVAMIQSNPELFRRALPGRSAGNPQYLHWSCDSGSDVVECDGTGIDGKFYPGEPIALNNGEGPLYQNGQFGDALYFNGKDAFVETSFSGIGGNAPRTVAFWAKIPKEFSIRNGYGMVSWGLMKPGQAWQISPNPAEKEGPLGRLRIGAMNAPIIGTTDLRDNRWHHVAVVMYGGDEADLSTHVLLYVDGQLEKTSLKSIVQIETELTHEKSRPLMFARNMDFDEDSEKIPNRFFKGWLDEIYLFDTALEPRSIRALMEKNRLE